MSCVVQGCVAVFFYYLASFQNVSSGNGLDMFWRVFYIGEIGTEKLRACLVSNASPSHPLDTGLSLTCDSFATTNLTK